MTYLLRTWAANKLEDMVTSVLLCNCMGLQILEKYQKWI